MILIDMNQIMISNLMSHVKSNNELDENLMRHIVLNNIRFYEKKFSSQYGELILCYDSKKYWRREFFPFYKQNRKRDRERSGLDWGVIFDCLNRIRDEIKQYFPYKVMEVDGAEADDVISVLCKIQSEKNVHRQQENQKPEKILILSGDKDFIQLQKYSHVDQYNPVMKKNIKCSRSEVKEFINEHVVKGDRSDGIPNYLSDDDTFVTGKRQKPLSKKTVDLFLEKEPKDICTDEQLKNYNRNQTLIDFNYIPEEIENRIRMCYNELSISNKSIPMEYFVKHNLNDLIPEFCFRTSTLPWLNK